ncbi:GTPase LSG1-2-like [Actinidia eriantha]|uniref:GTPase LSG1-2-like n=1 Tax=Actinidia eriantha TaxID=165200 RepID=UPI0025893F21|nr:GTPase LSG1-2-like [Actinidia eriantha]
MGKSEKTGLGRALVKHHNQMIQESKDKGRFYRNQQKKVLESITDVTDIDAVIEQADEAARLFSSDNPIPNLLVDPDSSSSISDMTPEERRKQQKKEEALHASSLRVPRRPPWNAKMSVEELDSNERQSFLIWRRTLARLEENDKLVLTPFEKNLDIWRQLWRVVERSDLLVMVVDARDPLFYRCPDLEAYAREIDEHKRTLLLINKADLLPFSVRDKWAKYFRLHGILFVFWSAKAASDALEGKTLRFPMEIRNSLQESDDADTKIYGREELLARLQAEAEEIATTRRSSYSSCAHSPSENVAGNMSKSVIVGFVGYPNVGKSSTINALVGEKRTGVTSTPGKTKHFQTLIMSDELTLCDCPGLVFPSFTSSRYEMIASGVLPIDRMTEHREAVQVVANRVPRHIIEDVYNITLPKPKPYEPQSRPPSAAELLRAYCASRGYVASSGLPDETRAARQILKDYIDGKLPHFELPPGMANDKAGLEAAAAAAPSSSEMHESDSNDTESPPNSEDESGPSLEHVLNDLNSFDMANGLGTRKVPVKKKPANASHKQHKKPQRTKNRSWRVQNDDGDGMPVVRVFQKPVNTGPVKIG